MKYFYIYLIIINIITFFAFIIDKRKAKKHRWRIRESVLLGLSAIGGSFGGLVAMETVRHKTKTLKFKIGMPLILIIQVAAFVISKYYGLI